MEEMKFKVGDLVEPVDPLELAEYGKGVVVGKDNAGELMVNNEHRSMTLPWSTHELRFQESHIIDKVLDKYLND
jgi:hypothetical protein